MAEGGWNAPASQSTPLSTPCKSGWNAPESQSTPLSTPSKSGGTNRTPDRASSLEAPKSQILPPRTRRCPSHKTGFIKTNDYERCLQIAKTAPVVILTGQRGSGKHLICRQVIRTLWLDGKNKDSHRIYDLKLEGDMSKALDISSIKEEYGDIEAPGKSDLSYYLLRLFQFMNEKSSNRNFVILDVCKLKTSLKDVLVSECLDVLLDELDSEKWTILCITESRLEVAHKNCVHVEGFSAENIVQLFSQSSSDDFQEGLFQHYANRIINDLHLRLPQDVKLVVSARIESVDSDEEFFTNYCSQLRAFPDSQASLNVAKTSIERCLDEDENLRESRKRYLGMLSFINHKDIPLSWLISFAEIAHSGDRPRVASTHVGKTMAHLSKFGLCTRHRRFDGSPDTFSMKTVVQEAMGMLFDNLPETERLDILRDSMIAVIREMPSEGHRYSREQIKNFLEHAHKMEKHSKIQELEASEDPRHNLIMLLHSKLLCGIGYCSVALRAWQEGEHYYVMAVDKYNETVNSGDNYTKLSDKSECASRGVELYAAGQKCQFISTGPFQHFVENLPRFHRFTEKSLKHMEGVNKKDGLVNNHLKKECYAQLLRQRRVLYKVVADKKQTDTETLTKVYMGELLARIFSSWAKVYLRACTSPDFAELPDPYAQLAFTANQICVNVRAEHDVYLLETMISNRTLELYKLISVGSYNEANDSHNRWVGISGRPAQSHGAQTTSPGGARARSPDGTRARSSDGTRARSPDGTRARSPDGTRARSPDGTRARSPDGTRAKSSVGQVRASLPASATAQLTRVFECGIVKSELEKDDYHMLCCLQGKLLALGKKYAYLDAEGRLQENILAEGEELMNEIRERTSKPSTPSTSHTNAPPDYWGLRKAHRSFAQYHSFCGNYEEAIRNMIHAMEYIRPATPAKLDPEDLPFVQHKGELQRYHEKRLQLQPSQPFIQPGEPAEEYLDNVIRAIPRPREFNRADEANPNAEWLKKIKDAIMVRLAITRFGEHEDSDTENPSEVVSIESSSSIQDSSRRPVSRPVQASDAYDRHLSP